MNVRPGLPATLAAVLFLEIAGLGYSQETKPGKGAIVEPTAANRTSVRADSGRRWAVVIGVNKYLDPQIPSLEYCVADARLMARTLREQCGYEANRILVLTDDQSADHLQPLCINLRKQIVGWLRNAEPDDTVLVFFSGHGFLDDRGQGFLAPKDCELAHLGLTGYRTDDLRDALQQCKATQKILLLDCCHAGAHKGVEVVGKSGEELGAAFAQAQGLITLASCGKSETSREWRDRGQGLFTYFMAEGLAGAADFDHNGLVDSDEAYRYALDKVSTTAQLTLNAQQRPVRHIPPDVVGVFVLSRVSGGTIDKPREPPRLLVNSQGMKLVLVPAGGFTMGSPPGEGNDNEHPAHHVNITRPFYIGQTEVTQRQFQAIMHRNPSAFSAGGKKADYVSGQDTSDLPVESVSCDEALEFCRQLSAIEHLPEGTYRLPTEAQWEYAARGGPAGEASDAADETAWTRDNSDGRPHAVAQKRANRLGLFDMLGNVSEWCSDQPAEDYYARSPANDPAGADPDGNSPRRVLRGGNWITKPSFVRQAARDWAPPGFKVNCYGFRVVREATPSP